ncbi:alpha-1,2-mannosyltransferase ALG9-like [Hypanus sabinus]|uniref:alpha-1,2-mannosyltransferase ALG9-like n=1 Tax=Hypanus sabinus TaxID=79690 RepID=UPI0028C39028|nr:alpha-1,2-mannosyltransferase ALG9-like [Hypanus sabinus]
MASKPRQRATGTGSGTAREEGGGGRTAREENGQDGRNGQSVKVWAPEWSTAFKCLISARFCAALLSNVSDCDEAFNYWEPTHFLLYGTGFQTWEYSPAYAVRSYAYLWLHALPAWFHARVLQTNKVLSPYRPVGGVGATGFWRRPAQLSRG